MKRTFSILILSAAFLTLLASCTELSVVADPGADQREIAVTPYSGLMTKSAINSNNTALPDVYDLKISASWNPASGSSLSRTNYFSDVQFAKDGSNPWKGSPAQYWPLAGTLDFIAYGCHGLNTAAEGVSTTPTWGDDGNVAKKVSIVTGDIATKFDDLVYGASNGNTCPSTTVNLSLKHACTALCFTFTSNTSAATSNIVVTSIAVNGVHTAGTFTFTNNHAAGGSSDDAASWGTFTDDAHSVWARVWSSTDGTASEQEVDADHSIAVGSTASTAPFGNAYVLIPAQTPTNFTITYNMGAITGLTHTYTCGPTETWPVNTKVTYAINFNLREITVTPTVVTWGTGSYSVTIQPAS